MLCIDINEINLIDIKGINIQEVVKEIQKGQMNANANKTIPSIETSKTTVEEKNN